MKKLILAWLGICQSMVLMGQQALQLAHPHVREYSPFFFGATVLQAEFAMDGAIIRFYSSIDQRVNTYNQPIRVKKDCSIKIWTECPGFLNSDTLCLNFYHAKAVPAKARLVSAPDPQYTGKGAVSMDDLKKGGKDVHDGNWLGFRNDSIVVEMEFSRAIRPEKFILSGLSSPSAWIWPASRILVYGESGSKGWANIGQWNLDRTAYTPSQRELIREVPLRPGKFRRFRVEVISFGQIPAGYSGAGSSAWLFVDEMLFQ